MLEEIYPEDHVLAGLPVVNKAGKRESSKAKVPRAEVIRRSRPVVLGYLLRGERCNSRTVFNALNLAAEGVTDAKSTGDALGAHSGGLGLYRGPSGSFLPCQQNVVLLLDCAEAEREDLIVAAGVDNWDALKAVAKSFPLARETAPGIYVLDNAGNAGGGFDIDEERDGHRAAGAPG